MSYVVHDKNLQRELNEYAKRLSFLIDNLKSDCSTGNTRKKNISMIFFEIFFE